MGKNKSVFIIGALILALIALIFASTYAFFSLNITGEGNNNEMNSFAGNMEITYNDTSNVSLINAYTGESITKTFTIENSGDATVYYDISFSEVTNNFADPEDLVYTISSTNNGALVSQTIVPTTSNNKLATAVGINAGVTQSYTLVITFLRTNEDQSDNANKTFSAKIAVDPTADNVAGGRIYTSNSLGYAILNNNTVLGSEGVNFEGTVTDGLYYTNSSIDGNTIYYFRGSSALNNNLIFAGKCWKIVRTTEDFGIRIIYNGEANGVTCTNITNDSTIITSSAFNENDEYNAYVGYMFGLPSSANYNDEHTNSTNSTIKGVLDNWYSNNINTYNTYISDSYYCNDRKPSSFTFDSVVYGSLGYGNNNTGYHTRYHIMNNNPTYNCYNILDIYTVDNVRGNGTLTNPIGLLTSAEAMFAGLNLNIDNSTNYLNNGSDYWTMTPAYYNGRNAYNSYITSSGKISEALVSTSYAVRPVITLKQGTILIRGNGSLEEPYIIN